MDENTLIGRIDCLEWQVGGLLNTAQETHDRVDRCNADINYIQEYIDTQLKYHIDAYLRDLIEQTRTRVDKELEEINLEDFELIISGGYQ